MKKIFTLIAISTALFLSGCASPYVGNLEYHRPAQLQDESKKCAKEITVTNFTDSRTDYPESDKRIGRLVGGFGDTLQAIEIPESLSVTVSNTVNEFLRDMGCETKRDASQNKDGFTLTGNIKQFYTMFFYAHKVAIEIDLSLTDNNTGEELWKGTASNYFGGLLFVKYPSLKEDPTIGCLGFTCHSKGINEAMNIMLSEALVDIWNNGGLCEAIKKDH